MEMAAVCEPISMTAVTQLPSPDAGACVKTRVLHGDTCAMSKLSFSRDGSLAKRCVQIEGEEEGKEGRERGEGKGREEGKRDAKKES